MPDFKKFFKFSFQNESVWMFIFGLLPLILGILVILILMLLNEI